MHEQSLIEALVRQLETVAAAEGAARITAVHVWCGALSHFTPEHFREHFERAAAGTVAEGADVEVEVSDDATHPDATGVRVLSVDVEG
ncbi:MAG TPA: hydrogenase maturation nickel metallochaperone HypA [Gaiellaceae bacterium]|nr:hydrogenase maturation nickel metallochaperone HypA [Gaiellaceae bacterium]